MQQQDDLQAVHRELIEALREARRNAQPELVKAVERWSLAVVASGKSNLARPSWLLTSSIVDKVVDYKKNSKVFAIVGFKKTDGTPRSPGTYGGFHEAGYAPDRAKPSAPTRFLRKAKKEQSALLKADVDEALKNLLETFRRISKK